MMAVPNSVRLLGHTMMLCSLLFLDAFCATNEVLGEIRLVGRTRVERTSGVWVDGQYVGYLKELKGSKKILLLPGEHEIVVRQAGYKDFSRKVVLQPGQKHLVQVSMEKDPRSQVPTVTAEVKLSVNPSRAAVFLDGLFVGHVDEFDGPGQALLVAPGKRRIKIALPGYQSFETEVNLAANQKFKIETDLQKGAVTESGSLPNKQH